MSNVRSILVIIVALCFSNIVSIYIIARNQSAGLYPADADSIGIPIYEGVILSALIFTLLMVAIYLPKKSLIGTISGLVLAVIATFLAAIMATGWAIPHHYEMAIANAVVFFTSGLFVVRYGKVLATNIIANK
jgi:hypothetical protein